MKKLAHFVFLSFTFLLSGAIFGQSKLPACEGNDVAAWSNCFGSWTTSNGSKYDGEYRYGKLNGQGTYTSADGEKYVGEFKDGEHEGQGIFTWPNGNKYFGEFKGDEPDGQGTYSWANGNIYFGEFKLVIAMDKEPSHGQMGKSTSANGKMGSAAEKGLCMEKREILLNRVFLKKESWLLPNT